MNLSVQFGKFSFAVGGTPSDTPTLQRSAALSPAQAWLRGEDWTLPGNNPYLASPYQQSVWVYTAASALAQTVSSIPFRISRGERSGESVLRKAPVVDLFDHPHAYLNRSRFWETLVTWYCLRGETFLLALDKHGHILPVRRAAGSPLPAIVGEGSGVRARSDSPSIRNPQSAIRNLLVLNPDHFRHVIQGHRLAGWRYLASPLTSPLGSMDLLPEEVIHDFLPNPYLFWRGMSPLSVALLAAQTDYASAQFMKGLMLNNADAGVIVRSDPQLSEEQRDQILAALRDRKSKAGVADRPVFLWGATDIVQPTLSSADLQFLENRKMNRQEICAAFFRIPQSLVGFTENANRSIAEAERLNFIENSIAPLCARLEAAVEPIVKSFGQDLIGWFDLDSHPILQAARRSRVDTAAKLFALGYPANAINKALDLGLPHLPWGDKGYLPASLQLAGELPPPPAKLQAPSPFEKVLGVLEQATPKSDESAQSDSSDLPNLPRRNGALTSFSLLASVALLLVLCGCDERCTTDTQERRFSTCAFIPPLLRRTEERAGERRQPFHRFMERAVFNDRFLERAGRKPALLAPTPKDPSLLPRPWSTNAFYYADGQVRIFSIDWLNLTPGHTYELQSSTDSKTWRRRSRITWTFADPATYWRTQLPMLPPTPAGLTATELFRLADITP